MRPSIKSVVLHFSQGLRKCKCTLDLHFALHYGYMQKAENGVKEERNEVSSPLRNGSHNTRAPEEQPQKGLFLLPNGE